MTDHDESTPAEADQTPETDLAAPPDALKEQVIAALRNVYDPEIPVNIYDMGLVYKIDVNAEGQALITITLTSPNCPAAEMIPADIKSKVNEVDTITGCEVEVVWEPTWDKDMMSEAAKLQLGFE